MTYSTLMNTEPDKVFLSISFLMFNQTWFQECSTKTRTFTQTTKQHELH